ncbi:extracellular solute-binding protein [Paenibacillus mucilaginosus]|uniref:Family 1 extracellular solute-binding protein n=2 Tax=Paenibacillus mucilaginosus TaxID=61624 RepID=H6NN32_9BACL|nr:extracellular solute-binding protein [Paenibacillus mucilaginosus]AEI44152.1 extracellular solute-binding protein family 1 [Paenibacillus mucilaginosus KNP414]AFC31708.1 family 1 extracellular solute-binding protein [Paenibacillus mucilaginosus 3016]MCG7212382.1 extracellular solute-binding protein [Paenibacillus mucilaginosus]WDM25576.1 extracellular solute-binding protein [Paenibacillus mucilaginosus]WFA20236.1 extracellular solute-binding protein [Paenibacillus mucilaginosus]
MKTPSKAWRKWTASFLVTVLSLSTLAACSSGGKEAAPASGAAGGAASGSGSGPYKLNIMLPTFKTTFPKDNSPVVQELNKYLNAEMHLEWVPNNSYPEKLNITLASGKLPTIMVIDSKSPSFINAARTGAFWELGPYLKDYPNLSKANPIVLNNSSIDGKNYGIYRTRALARNGIMYRKDWLENVGLQEPKTIDDFYNILKAFATKDPDKNGKNDTYGMVISKFTGPFEIMQTWFGVPNKWGPDASGQLLPAHLFPEYMDSLKFFKKLYDEKLINADFAVMDTGKWNDPVVNGQAGVIVDVTDNAGRLEDKIHAALEKAGKDDKSKQFMDIVDTVEGPKGKKNLPTSGYSGVIAISKTGAKTEEDLKKALTFLDKLNDEKAQILAGNGIEGMHYKKVEGGIEPVKDPAKLEGEVEGLNQMLTFLPEDRTLKVVQTPLRQKITKVQKEAEQHIVPNPAEPLVSNVYSQKGPQLDTMISDARTKFIVGQIDEAGFKAAVELWRKSGGDEYVKEINELYAKMKK